MQPYSITPFVRLAFAKNGDADAVGVITVDAASQAIASTTLWPGARVIVGSDTKSPLEALILEDLGFGKYRVRLDDSAVGVDPTGSTNKAGSPVAVPTPGAGSSWSGYTTAGNAYITQLSGQYIFPYTRDGIVPRSPSALR
jgi:hypothetical protein